MKCWKIGVLVVVGVAALGWVVMALWNWLLPELFGIREIGYVQAMGVLLLSKILFGGFRGHCGGHHKWHHHRLEDMTPEQREKFKSGMGGCCGGKHKHDRTGESSVPDVRT
jgi:peptidoglycan/xylan/chitin deacetylase (PgdA/CDA1 family)